MPIPRISIGMPVYNSRPDYFWPAIDSLLGQSLDDFELLISDNGSDPSYVAMYESAAQRDPRIRYVRHPFNKGPTFNFVYCANATRGEYFCWAADDDVREPDHLKACAELLDREPTSVLATTQMVEMGPDGRLLSPVQHDVRLGHSDVMQRVQALGNIRYVYDIYGLFRREHLVRSPVVHDAFHRDEWGADNVVVFSAMLAGPVVRTTRPLFRYRIKPDDTCLTRRLVEAQNDDPALVEAAEGARARNLVRAVWNSGLPPQTRMGLLLRLTAILSRSPYTNERKFMARRHFQKAMERQDYVEAARMALRYWRLSPLAPLRGAAWKSAARRLVGP